jgi:energy-coupling factor transporter transmembrane protein EcfT
MTDIIIVGLLLIIILILISVFAPEVFIYGLLAFSVIGLVICVAIMGAQFVHDPIGFLYSGLVTNNPLIIFMNSFMSSMPTFGGLPTSATPVIEPGSPMSFAIIAYEVGVVITICYVGYRMFVPSSGKRRDDVNDK